MWKLRIITSNNKEVTQILKRYDNEHSAESSGNLFLGLSS
jgi:hypothetical protein